jgi:anti-anti-sigma regulatory factor
MEFKIDTRPSYTLITPLSEMLNANLTGAIRQKWLEIGQSGSHNLIVDFKNCVRADATAYPAMLLLHQDFYAQGCSLVYTGTNQEIAQQIKSEDDETRVNIVPSIDEAVDIISMEILERDLFNEE